MEKGMSIYEHVVLTVQGLTCVGCETKLRRSLALIPTVRNVQTSLVLLRAEFELDKDSDSVENVIRSVQSTTGFACTRIIAEGQDLEVIVPDHMATLVGHPRPFGVQDIVQLDKQKARITYNAEIVGARDLLERHLTVAVQLAPPRPDPTIQAGNKHVRHTAIVTVASIALTIPVLVLAWASLPPHEILYGAVSLGLATLVQFGVAGPFYPSALRGLLFTRVIEMDLLIVLSTSTAYIFSIVSFAYQVSGRPLATGGFFETSTLLVTLIMLGRLVSALARQKAVESISVRSLQPTTAILINGADKSDREIDARLLQLRDLIKVPPDSRIVTDGVVVAGTTEVDESMVTGESALVAKVPGQSVIAGSLNGSGVISIRVTHLPGQNTISEIARLVDAAKFSKARTQALADRAASYFVPIVVVLTIITFVTWIGVGVAVRQQRAATAVVQAMTYAIAVLIVSCPCAVGLAVPMVVVIAGGVAATHGVVFKSADTIEIARQVDHVVFDKTGTLTRGQLAIVDAVYLSDTTASTSGLVLGLTRNINHPVSRAVASHLQSQGVLPLALQDVHTVPGSGIEARWGDVTVRAGNSRWIQAEAYPQVAALLGRGLTVFCVSDEKELLAVFGLQDGLRDDAMPVVAELQRRGIAVSLVSGDDRGAVDAAADSLGIPPTHVRSRARPTDKQQYIQELVRNGARTVLFCGDGTNDAIALAQASIGVHVNEGSEVAQSAADVVLIRPILHGILVLIDLSRAAYRRIIFNFLWAAFYNVFAILLAAGVFVKARIPPQYAGLGEIISVLPVVFVALQLKWARL